MSTDGYPDRHRAVIASAARASLRTIAVTGSLAALFAAAAVWWGGSVLIAAIAAAIFILATLGSVLGLWDCLRWVRIIPYFESTVGGIETFLAGEALARHLRQLDDVAADIGVTPLSEFGFNDDLCGETLVWHDAEDGLSALLPLLAALEARPDRIEARDPLALQCVQCDLRKMIEALQKARQGGIRFCLLLRHGNGTSALEWEQRKGTAF